MKCVNCNADVNENMKFCPKCGASVVFTKNNEVENNGSSIQNQQVGLGQVNTPNINNNQNINPGYTNYNNVQPNVQPYNNYSQAYQFQQPSPEKKNNSLIIIVVVVALAFAICVGIIIYSVAKNNDEDVINSNSNSNIIQSNINSNITSNTPIQSNINSNITSNTPVQSNINSNVVQSNSNSNIINDGRTITFSGYVLTIPSNYTVSSVTTQLQLLGTNKRDVVGIQIVTGDYNTIKSSQTTMKAYMQNSGYTVNNVQVANYNNVEFISATVEKDGKNMVLAYSNLGNGKVMVIVVANISFTIDYAPLYDFANVVKTAKLAS